jgi:acid phosphatase type 7
MVQTRRALLRTALYFGQVALGAGRTLWAAALARLPFLQNVRSDRAVLLAAADQSGQAIIQVSRDRTFPDSGTISFGTYPTDLPGFIQYQAELLNLQPATRYYYRVVLDGRTVAPAAGGEAPSFRTAPVSGPFRFLVLGDSGSGSAEQRNLARLMAAEPVSLVLHTGDLVYPEGSYENFQSKYFEIYGDLMERVPFFPTLGNHDTMVDNAAPYLSLHNLPIEGIPAYDRGRYCSFDWGDVHFVNLDSESLKNVDRSARMLAWAEQDLKTTKKPWKIAYWHHSPYDPYRGNDFENTAARERFVPLLEKYGVQLVFNGHYHAYNRTKPILRGQEAPAGQGIVYIITGGGGGSLHAKFSSPLAAFNESAYHYLSVEFLGGSLVVRAILQDGSVLDSVTLAPPPAANPFSVVNGASFGPTLAPGSIVSVFGQFLSPTEGSAPAAPLPTELCNIRLTLNGTRLPLFFASHSQINAQLPFDAAGEGTLRLTTPAGFVEKTVTVGRTAPGIFNLGASVPALTKADGSLVSETNPASPGEYVIIYLTGLGRVSGNISAGSAAPSAPLLRTIDPVQVLIEDKEVSPSFAGLAPGQVGLYQVNVQIPSGATTGKRSLRVSSSGAVSNEISLFVR